jgi:hypothetical protein
MTSAHAKTRKQISLRSEKGCGRRTPPAMDLSSPIHSEVTGGTTDRVSENTNDEDKSWFQIWENGLRENKSEQRWAGLLGMIDSARTYLDDEQFLQPLLELGFWEAAETLPPSHPRKEMVMNLFMTLSTWEGYLRVTWTYMALWFWGAVELVYRRRGMTARMENLTVHREQIRTAMRSNTIREEAQIASQSTVL